MSYIILLRHVNPRSVLLVILAVIVLSSIIIIDVGFLIGLTTLYDRMVFRESRELVLMSYALAPFTSIVTPSDIVKLIGSNVPVDYEVLVPCIVDNQLVLVRGLNITTYINKGVLKLKVGRTPHNHLEVLIGSHLAKVLNVEVEDVLLIITPYIKAPIPVVVVGIIESTEPYCNEIIAQYMLGLKLRGLSQGGSIARIHNATVHVKAVKNLEQVAPMNTALLEKIIIALKREGKGVIGVPYKSPVEVLASRLGISRDIVSLTCIVIALVLTIGVYTIGGLAVIMNRNHILILHEVGVPIRTFKLILVLLVFIAATIAYITALTIIPYIVPCITHILGYPIKPELTPITTITSYIAIILILILGVIRESI